MRMHNDDEHVKADYLLLRIGGVVTDPPLPLQHLETAIGETVTIEPADRTDAPQRATFPEFPLAAIALSDIVRCLVLAINPSAEYKPGVRTVTAVGPSVFSRRPVVDVMESWYGREKASEIDMEYHRMPGNEYKPIYDTEAAERELGFVAKVDFRMVMFVELAEDTFGRQPGGLAIADE